MAESKDDLFADPDVWCAEMLALMRIEGVAKLMTDLGNSIVAGKTSDVTYYRRARVMLADAVEVWSVSTPGVPEEG